MDNIDPKTIWIFSPLDKWMRVMKNQKQVFVGLFDRKKELIQNVKSLKIDAKVYKKLMKSSYKSGNDFIKKCVEEDLMKLKDVKNENAIEQWFRQMIEDTGRDFDEQESLYNSYKKVENVKKESSLSEAKKSMIKSSLKISEIKNKTKQSEINFTEVVSFRAADNLLEHFEDNIFVYDNVLDRKAKMLSLVDKKKFDGQKYKKIIQMTLPKIKNEEILFDTQFQYDNLKDIHDGQVVPWFEEILEETKERLTQQAAIFKKLKERSKLGKSNESTSGKQPPLNQQNKEPLLKYSIIKNKELNVNQIYSFQALMNFIKNNEQNQQLVSLLKQRVKTLLQDCQSKALTASKYKSLIERSLKGSSDDVKESILFELNLLSEVNNGDVQDWFQDIIGTAKLMESQGKPIEEQAHNKQLNGQQSKRKVSGTNISVVRINLDGLSQIEISRDIYFQQVKHFRSIDYFMNEFKHNPEMYRSLIQQKEEMLREVSSNHLTPQKYLQLLQGLKANTLNQQIKKRIQFDMQSLAEKYKGKAKQWFEANLKETTTEYENQKIIFSTLKKQNRLAPSSIQAASNIEKYQIQRKSYLFLRAMAVYQSLLYFHRKNKVPYDNHKYLMDYQKKIKRKAYEYLEQMEKNKNLDVQNLISELFPPLNQHIFYNGSLQQGKKKMEQLINGLTIQIAALRKYSSEVKKNMNVQNLETVRKQIAKCEQNIKLLRTWPHRRFEPFPDVKVQKVQKMNMDLNKLEPNELQIIVTNIQGLSTEHTLFIYVGSFQVQKFKCSVVNGSQPNTRLIIKLNEKQMAEIMKGSRNIILLRFFKKGFFSGMELISEVEVESHFSRTNTAEGKVLAGNFGVYYILKVQKPSRPLYTDINHFNITFFPSYEHSSFIEQQLIKKYIPYTNPTPSEIHI